MLDSGTDFVCNPAGVLRGAVELQHALGTMSHSSTRLLDANPNDTLVSRRSSLTFWLKLILGSVLPQFAVLPCTSWCHKFGKGHPCEFVT